MFTKSLTLLSLIAAVLAAPTSLSSRHASGVTITLVDATKNTWPISISSTEVWTPTHVVESISHIHIVNDGYVPCTFYGADGAIILAMPGDVKDVDVGAPQTIVGGICGPCTFE